MPRQTSWEPMLSTRDFNSLKEAVLEIIENYSWQEPILGEKLTKLLARSAGQRIDQRKVREAIKDLRRDGHLIGSRPGEYGGYYKIRTKDEFETFMRMEFIAKISDMSETMRSMNKSALEAFPQLLQPSLID